MQALLRPIRNRCMSRNRPRHGSQPRNCRLSPHQNLGRGKPRNRRVRYYGGITDGDTLLTMFGDFADLWERAAADGMPLREIVGDDPVPSLRTLRWRIVTVFAWIRAGALRLATHRP
jgi:hypothetical protein